MMAVRFVAMRPELFGMIPLAPAFRDFEYAASEAAKHAVCAAPNFALAMLDGGRVLGAGGVIHVWHGRGHAWMLPGLFMERRHFGMALARCRMEIARLQTAGTWRIEAAVRKGVADRGRWVARLGFRCEGVMRRFSPDGADFDLWALLPPTYDERHSLIERVAA